MLILTRKVGESVVIDDDIEVTVLGIKGGQVRLGVTAPAEVKVHRDEVYRKLNEDKSGQSIDPALKERLGNDP